MVFFPPPQFCDSQKYTHKKPKKKNVEPSRLDVDQEDHFALQNSTCFLVFVQPFGVRKNDNRPSLKGISSSNHWNSQGQTGC